MKSLLSLALILLSLNLSQQPALAQTQTRAQAQTQTQSQTQTVEIFALPDEKLALLPSDGVFGALKYSQSTWVASFVPGLGQIMLDEPVRGGLFMGGFVLAFPVGFGLGYGIGSLLPAPQPDPRGGLLSGLNLAAPGMGILCAMLVPIGVYIWNLMDAYALNFKKNEEAQARLQVQLDASGNLSWQLSKF